MPIEKNRKENVFTLPISTNWLYALAGIENLPELDPRASRRDGPNLQHWTTPWESPGHRGRETSEVWGWFSVVGAPVAQQGHTCEKTTATRVENDESAQLPVAESVKPNQMTSHTCGSLCHTCESEPQCSRPKFVKSFMYWNRSLELMSQCLRSLISVNIQGLIRAPLAIMTPISKNKLSNTITWMWKNIKFTANSTLLNILFIILKRHNVAIAENGHWIGSFDAASNILPVGETSVALLPRSPQIWFKVWSAIKIVQFIPWAAVDRHHRDPPISALLN